MGIHALISAQLKEQIASKEQELKHAQEQLKEALRFGDLSENAEYSASRQEMHNAVRQLDLLKQIESMDVIPIPDDDNDVIVEGCVLHLRVLSVKQIPTTEPLESFLDREPLFDQVIMFGGSTEYHDLVSDGIQNINSMAAQGLLGKRSGIYEIPVPDGFAIMDARVLKKAEYADKKEWGLNLD